MKRLSAHEQKKLLPSRNNGRASSFIQTRAL
jgi:hypothetical protein